MLKKKLTIPVLSSAEKIHKSMRSSERWVFYALSLLLVLSSISLVNTVYTNISVLVPSSGGSITEGVIGAPRFVNPILSVSQTDKDITSLIYAGLMTRDIDGNIVPELARSYSISEDNREYTFILHRGLVFHDDTPLTVDDVIFTVEKAIQPDIKSPERANWEGVTVTKIDDYTVTFSLEKPYAQFLQNTLLGILPQEHLDNLTADEFIFSKLNTEPIGSGPYKFISATHNSSGIPEKFILERFNDYILGTPFINRMTINFYPNRSQLEEAFYRGELTSISEIRSQDVYELLNNTNSVIHTSTLPRIFAIFFNQNNNESLANKYIREILRDVINRDLLIDSVFNGHAKNIDSIILTLSDKSSDSVLTVEQARERLENNGWNIDEETGFYTKDDDTLSITLTTVNNKELKKVASIVINKWRSIGIDVKLEVFESGNLSQSVLRTRDYEALLFGTIVGTDPDPYAFWHSSQRNDPGLNIANYANSAVDRLLVKARKTVNSTERASIYQEVADKINEDVPAIFLYAPNFIYLTSRNILGIDLAPLIEPADRFNNIHLWHINTSRILQFLSR